MRSIHSRDGRIEYDDNEYIRNGTVNIFLFLKPLNGWSVADAKEHRMGEDWTEQIKWLLDEQYPEAEKVVLAMNNLNTHSIASLYQTFEPSEAFRLAGKLEIHYTQKHGNWLDIAEIELSALARQCIESNRIPNLVTLKKFLESWFVDRSRKQKSVQWQFFTEDAKNELRHLYPILNL